MNEPIITEFDNAFLGKWVWLTAAGWSAAYAVAKTVTAWTFPDADPTTLASSPLFYAVFGALLGFAQWWAVRAMIPRSSAWILATAGGLFVAGWLLNKRLYLIEPFSTPLQNLPALADVVIGVILGFSQYLVLRKKIRFAYVWLLMFPEIWVISIGIMQSNNAWLVLLGTFSFAGCTGFAMERLLHLSLNQDRPPNTGCT